MKASKLSEAPNEARWVERLFTDPKSVDVDFRSASAYRCRFRALMMFGADSSLPMSWNQLMMPVAQGYGLSSVHELMTQFRDKTRDPAIMLMARGVGPAKYANLEAALRRKAGDLVRVLPKA